LSYCCLSAQVQEDKSVCKLNCDKEINTENAKLISSQMGMIDLKKIVAKAKKTKFPIRFVFVEDETFESASVRKKQIKSLINGLNKAFRKTKFKFSIHKIEAIQSFLSIEDLSTNENNIYVEFSKRHDLDNYISVSD